MSISFQTAQPMVKIGEEKTTSPSREKKERRIKGEKRGEKHGEEGRHFCLSRGRLKDAAWKRRRKRLSLEAGSGGGDRRFQKKSKREAAALRYLSPFREDNSSIYLGEKGKFPTGGRRPKERRGPLKKIYASLGPHVV